VNVTAPKSIGGDDLEGSNLTFPTVLLQIVNLDIKRVPKLSND